MRKTFHNLFNKTTAFFGLILFFPLFIIIAVFIKIDSKGSIFFLQKRVGLNKSLFNIIKFRTMFVNRKKILLTHGKTDNRITKVGFFLRKYKLDELPQLFNVVIGDMNFVGPRPEVPRYVEYYNTKQLKILKIKPGITDVATLKYRNEEELLSEYSGDLEKFYLSKIMPDKIDINLKNGRYYSIINDIKIILKTIRLIIN